jgi:type I restriction enzyme S subunit
MSENLLPVNWQEWRLADVGTWLGGGTPSKSNENFWHGSIPWVSPKDMKAPTIVDSEDHISEDAVENSAAKMIPPGSVLFVTRSGILAHSFPVATTKTAVTINQDLKAITPTPAIDSGYLAWALRAYERLILDKCRKHGTTVHSIEAPTLKAFCLPIAPYSEQCRIVAKLEELLSELDKGVESLKTAREELRVYCQVLLKHAFEGKLTACWRAETKDRLETADQLFGRIKQEREAHHQHKLEQWRSAVKDWEANKDGKKPSRLRALKPVTSLSKDVLAGLEGLPLEWLWEKLGWMTCGVDYGTAAKSSEAGQVPVVRMGNLQNGKIDWEDLVYSSDEAEIDQYSLQPGDVLFNRTNSPELVGKTAIYRGERPALFAGYLIRVNHIEAIVDSQYLNLFLNSHVARQHGNSVKTDGVNQSNINGEKLQNYPFPYCSLLEQREIVRVLDEKLSLVEQMQEEIETALPQAEALRQSILEMAFSGRLVGQNPTDEPASMLLERIKTENSQQVMNNKNGKRKAAA